MADEIIRILSMDGGGIRGIIPARLLQRIEESIGEPASTLFHLIAGTFTGGILGCGLAKGKSAREYRFDISLGESPKQDPDAVNEDFDDASPDNIKRIERKAAALINGEAGKLQTVIDELKKPKWNPATA